MNIRILPALFLLLQAVLAPLAAAAENRAIRIGAILPLSGNMAHLGESVRNGLLFSLERSSGNARRFQIVFEDDRFNPRLSAAAAQKLISRDHIQVLITLTSGPGNAVAPIAERAHVAHFCLTVDSRLANGSFNFVHLYESRAGAQRLLQKLAHERLQRIGILHFTEDAAELSAQELRRQARAHGLDVACTITFPAGTTDFRSLLTRLRGTPADTLVVIALPPELDTLVRQIRELRLPARLTTIEVFSLTRQPELYEGLWFANPAPADSAYLAAYESRFGPEALWAPYADSLMAILAAAAEQCEARSCSVDSLAAHLRRLQGVPTLFGPLSAAPGGIFSVPVVISVMRHGRVEELER